MPKAQQPTKPLKSTYDPLEFLRESEILHKRLNDLLLSPPVADLVVTKADYVAADVGSAATIAAALNTIANALNSNTAAVNQLLAKLNLT